MPNIQFKAKVEKIYNMDNTLAYERIKVPAITHNHCDMAAFRSHADFGGFANSDLFSNMIKRALSKQEVPAYIKLDSLPDCVTVEHGFLAKVTISLVGYRNGLV
jgi:hypothetical protein